MMGWWSISLDRYIRRGSIWIVDLNPSQGHEQNGTRPVLVVSADGFNQTRAGLVFVAPLTRTDRRIPFHVSLEPPEGGIRERSFILCDATRSLSIDRFTSTSWGMVSISTMKRVEDQLRILLNL